LYSTPPPSDTILIRYSSDNIYESKLQTMLETIKIKLLKLLINSIFKYNSDECKDKWMETTIDDIKYLIE